MSQTYQTLFCCLEELCVACILCVCNAQLRILQVDSVTIENKHSVKYHHWTLQLYAVIHLFCECSCGVQFCDVFTCYNMIYLVKKRPSATLHWVCSSLSFESPVRRRRRLISHVMTREFKKIFELYIMQGIHCTHACGLMALPSAISSTSGISSTVGSLSLMWNRCHHS